MEDIKAFYRQIGRNGVGVACGTKAETDLCSWGICCWCTFDECAVAVLGQAG